MAHQTLTGSFRHQTVRWWMGEGGLNYTLAPEKIGSYRERPTTTVAWRRLTDSYYRAPTNFEALGHKRDNFTKMRQWPPPFEGQCCQPSRCIPHAPTKPTTISATILTFSLIDPLVSGGIFIHISCRICLIVGSLEEIAFLKASAALWRMVCFESPFLTIPDNPTTVGSFKRKPTWSQQSALTKVHVRPYIFLFQQPR